MAIAVIATMMMVATVPAVAQTDDTGETGVVAQEEEKEKKGKDKKGKDKKGKEKEKTEATQTPESGGIVRIDTAALLGLGAGALLVGSWLLARRIVRDE
jgi:hypothetical protein